MEGEARFCSRRAEQLGGDWATTWASDGDGKREMEICVWVWVWRLGGTRCQGEGGDGVVA